MKSAFFCFLLLNLLIADPAPCLQAEVRFRSDDPLWVDPDRNPVPVPETRDLSQIFDFIENTWRNRPKKDLPVARAENINTLGEVPDSSWFTNRIGRRPMSIAELVRGPNQRQAPDQSAPWNIVSVKTQGVTPGFTIRDARGEVYFIKFDPPNLPQLTTSCEVIATKFFYAFGFNVPENYLTFLRREDLIISPELRMRDQEGKTRPVLESDISEIFERVYLRPDGTAPAVASRRLDGIPLGPFKYIGTREDDPNDIFQHENRRELRGLRLFSAWLNHDDARSINSLDLYNGEPGLGWVEHALIDFGSCFGSGSVKLQSHRAGNEYLVEWRPIFLASVTFGIWDRPWRKFKYPNYPAVGRFEHENFKPELWRPEYPNPAFERMQADDAFWATKIILNFTDETVRALVRTGEIQDPAAEEYLCTTLIQRRDKIVKHYLPRANALDAFRITGSDGAKPALEFTDLSIKAGFRSSDTYRYRWYRFDNQTGEMRDLNLEGTTATTRISIPKLSPDFLGLVISAGSSGPEKTVTVFLRQAPELKLVGLERH